MRRGQTESIFVSQSELYAGLLRPERAFADEQAGGPEVASQFSSGGSGQRHSSL